MPNVKGLLADPEFNKLDPMQQRHVLGQVDPQFSQLSDEDYQTFRQKVMPVTPAPAGIWDRFKKTVTTDSPLNPMNWPGMVSSAFESPFSDQSMQEAGHQQQVMSGKVPPAPFERGDIGEGLGTIANMGVMGLAGKGLGAIPGTRMGAALSGAAKGGWEGATDMVPSTHWPMSQLPSLPAPVAGGVTGAAIGKYLGGQPGEVAGGMIGAGAPIVRGAWQGGKQALKRFGADIPKPPVEPTVAAPPVPAPSAAEQSLPGGKAVIADDQIPVKAHETNVKVDQQIKDKVNNLAEYLRSKGGTPEHLDMIGEDPALTRQYLNEAHSYGKNKGNTVPKTGYKGLDKGSDSFKQVRQKMMDMIEEEKNKP